MMFFLNVLFSSVLISFASWLSHTRPALAGFVIALPLSSLIAIGFSHAHFADTEKTVLFAKSIFVSIPLSLTFFLPFLFAKQLKLPFWGLYVSGILLLSVSYGIHQYLFKET